MAAVKKVGQKNGEVGLLVEYLFCDQTKQMKRFGVLPIRIVKSNVSNVGPSSVRWPFVGPSAYTAHYVYFISTSPPIELVGIECALGHVTGVYFYKHFALINPPYWIYLYCSKRIIQ